MYCLMYCTASSLKRFGLLLRFPCVVLLGPGWPIDSFTRSTTFLLTPRRVRNASLQIAIGSPPQLSLQICRTCGGGDLHQDAFDQKELQICNETTAHLFLADPMINNNQKSAFAGHQITSPSIFACSSPCKV